MTRLVLGLGSSDRDGLGCFRRALAALKALPDLRILRVSPVYRSDAMLPSGAPDSWNLEYLNLAALVEVSTGSPEDWLDRFQLVETTLGRIRRDRWAPRVIDVDILTWGQQILATDRLKVPHPGLLDRPFALLPLADLAPDWVHPDVKITARELALRWRGTGEERPVPFRTRRSQGSLTEIVGILNVTPDSFSDGGKFQSAEGFLAQARRLVLEGATVLDVGGESTRPGAGEVTPACEFARLVSVAPALARIRAEHPEILLSLDTRNAATVRQSSALPGSTLPGWNWINDVNGLRSDEMVESVVESGADAVFMHSLSVPPRKDEVLAPGEEVVDFLLDWARGQSARLVRLGIPREKQIFDPGVGFGKSSDQNLAILKQAWRLHALGLRILIGHSRKSFIAGFSHAPASDRDLETVLVSVELQRQGVEFVRVHRADWHFRAFNWSRVWDGVIHLDGAGGASC